METAYITIGSICSSLDYLSMLEVHDSQLADRRQRIKHFLKCLQTFVVCARTFGEGVELEKESTQVSDSGQRINFFLQCLHTVFPCATTLGDSVQPGSDGGKESLDSLLDRIGEAVVGFAHNIQPYCRAFQTADGVDMDILRIFRDFEAEYGCFGNAIDKWYTNLSHSLRHQPSRVLTIHDVAEIVDPVYDNLLDFKTLSQYVTPFSINQIEEIQEKMTLFRSFISFAAVQSADELEPFVIHFASVAITAAHVTALLYDASCTRSNSEDAFSEDLKQQSRIVALLQKIKVNSIDPQVFQTFKTSMASLNSPAEFEIRPLDLDPFIVVKDSIDFLSWILWETQQMDPQDAQEQPKLLLLWVGLRFLRTILEEHPHKLDEKIGGLSIPAVVCDAGAIVFSLHQGHVEIDSQLEDVLNKLRMIRADVEEQDPLTSMFNLPKTSVLDFLRFLLNSMMEVKADSPERVQAVIESLKSVAEELRNLPGELQALWNRVVQVASRIEFLIDQMVLGGIPISLDSISEQIRILEREASKISPGDGQEMEDETEAWAPITLPPQNSYPVTDEVVGLEKETMLITSLLTGGFRKLKTVAIVGMPGLGKTTIATRVYSDPSVRYHFHERVWCSVSQEYSRKKLLLVLLSQLLRKQLPDVYREKSDHDLADEVRRRLKRRRYLIFLDDVWETEVLNSLQHCFPDDHIGSRILLTSRNHNVVPRDMLDGEPFALRSLNKDESWKLLKKRVFGKEDCPTELYQLGRDISDDCNGLPLTIVIVSGLLVSREPERWEEVLEKLRSNLISSTKQCQETLELSYKHLPDNLKPCFLYFGLFPEDEEISVKQLIWLWISEGLVPETDVIRLEDIAANYVMDLSRRSLVMVSKKGSTGGIKACRIHDLLHDFCISKAEKDGFFQLLKGNEKIVAFNEPCYLPRLCIHSRCWDFKNLKLFRPKIRSLHFFSHTKPSFRDDVMHDISHVVLAFKHLQILNIRPIYLGSVFPSKMELLHQLRYLAVRGHFDSIPSSVGNLLSLETFILHSQHVVALPDTIWNLNKLRHIYVPNCFRVSMENLETSTGLYALESCSTVLISSRACCEKLLSRFSNICKLKCRVSKEWDMKSCNEILIPDSLNLLESLHLRQERLSIRGNCQFEFHFPPYLTKLTLDQFELLESEISVIGSLQNLEVLKLLAVEFCGKIFNIAEREFVRLEVLKLTHSNIVKWSCDDDDQLQNLRIVVLEGCPNLEEIPLCLSTCVSLQMIQVLSCSQSIENQVKEIKDMQGDLGNSDMRVFVRSRGSAKTIQL